jgi:indolepyruvate ferredoxin oxidoreductase alpha subunit
LSHSSGDVELGDIRKEKNYIAFDKHWKSTYRWNVYGPPGPVEKHKWQKDRLPMMNEFSNATRYNQYTAPGNKSKLGIITSGIASSYVIEALKRLKIEEKVHLLVLGVVYPVPQDKVTKILQKCDSVICIEEGDTVIEKQTYQICNNAGLSTKIYGKTSGKYLSPVDELNPDKVIKAISDFTATPIQNEDDENVLIRKELAEIVASRSSSWCPGCPHLGSFWALKKSLPQGKVNIINVGIGCYEMSGYGIAASPISAHTTKESKRWPASTPYEVADTLYIMGSETGLSQGEFHAGYKDGKIISVLGDSSFFHTNLSPIVNAVYNKTEQLILILDNFWTCMTGHQPNPMTGITAMGEKSDTPSIEGICSAFGVKFVHYMDPYDLKKAKETILEALNHKGGPAVLISRRVCALQRFRELRRARSSPAVYKVNEKCTGCRQCVQLGCPAIGFDLDKTNAVGKKGVAFIDSQQCVGCSLCTQEEVCVFDAHDKTEGANF